LVDLPGIGAKRRTPSGVLRAAWCNAVDRLRSESRRRAREGEYALWRRLDADGREIGAVEAAHDVEALRSRLADVDFRLSPAERRALRLLFEGERATSVWARVLALEDRPTPEQRRAVKRVRDRLLKRLRRWWRW
jgi:hypothetical protein